MLPILPWELAGVKGDGWNVGTFERSLRRTSAPLQDMLVEAMGR